MKLCPNCKESLTEVNSYFGIETCPKCGFEDDTVKRMRDMRDKIFLDPSLFKRYEKLLEKIVQEGHKELMGV